MFKMFEMFEISSFLGGRARISTVNEYGPAGARAPIKLEISNILNISNIPVQDVRVFKFAVWCT